MVKGVHKKIIEMKQPDSMYFEKAVFYLKPGITQFPAQLAESEARRFLATTSRKDQRSHRWRKIGKVILISSISSCATMILCYILIRL